MRDAGNLRIHLLSLVSGRIIAVFAALSRGTVTHPILFKILVLKLNLRAGLGSGVSRETRWTINAGKERRRSRQREREKGRRRRRRQEKEGNEAKRNRMVKARGPRDVWRALRASTMVFKWPLCDPWATRLQTGRCQRSLTKEQDHSRQEVLSLYTEFQSDGTQRFVARIRPAIDDRSNQTAFLDVPLLALNDWKMVVTVIR